MEFPPNVLRIIMTTHPSNLQDLFNLSAEPYHELLKKEEAELAVFIKEVGERTVFKIDNDITHARSILKEIQNSNAEITGILNQYNELHGEIITALGTLYPSFENITSSSASIVDMSEFIIFLNKTKEDLLGELQSTPNNDSLHEIINLLKIKGEQLSILHVQAMAKERVITEHPKPLDRILSLDKEKKCSLEKERAIAMSKDKIVTIKQILNLLEKNKQINQLMDDFIKMKLSFDSMSIAQDELSSIEKQHSLLEKDFFELNQTTLISLRLEKLDQINGLTKNTKERIKSIASTFYNKMSELMTIKFIELENESVLFADFNEENSLENIRNSMNSYDNLLKECAIIDAFIANSFFSNFNGRLNSLKRTIDEKRSNLLDIIALKLTQHNNHMIDLYASLMKLNDVEQPIDNFMRIKEQFSLITEKNQLFDVINPIDSTDRKTTYMKLQKAIGRAETSQEFLLALDTYLNQRTYPVKDIVTPSDRNFRKTVIGQIKQALAGFVTTGETATLLDLLKNNKFSGNTLQPLLNRLNVALTPLELDDPVSQDILNEICTHINNQNSRLAQQIADLYNAICSLKLQGEKIKETDTESGLVAINLAKDLSLHVDHFLITHRENLLSADQAIFTEFQASFSIRLHSQTDTMKKHRAIWKPIIANIFLAIATLGVATGIQLLISKFTGEKRATFFFQDTKRMNIVDEINEAAERMVPAA